MKKILFFMWMCIFLFSSGIVFAQKSTVSGKITEQNGNPLPGVSIIIKGTTVGTISTGSGTYTLNEVSKESVLVYSFVGMKSKEILVSGQKEINVVLEEETIGIDEVVAIGYGTQKKSDLTGSVSVVNTESLQKIATNDISKALQGMVAGVTVQSGGEPGALPRVKIRGIGSFNNNAPLYVVDGVAMPINDLPMGDIESMQVLKDGSAAAIYGSRAANGVVIITTKRGKAGDLKINYKGSVGVQNITERYEVANREEYQLLVNEATTNANDPRFQIMPANNTSNPLFVKNTDTNWQDEVFKTGKISDHTVNISGGSQTSTFNISMNYFDQSGTVVGKGPKYDRYSISVNSDHTKGKFKFGESVHYTVADQKLMSFVHDGTILGFTVSAIPTIPVYDSKTMDGYGASDKTVDGSYTANVIGFNEMIDSSTKRFRFSGNAYGEYAILKDLKYKLSLSYERTDWRDFHFDPKHNLGWFYVNNIAKMNDDRGYAQTATLEQTITYDKTFGKHKITLLGGNTILDGSMYRIFGKAEGFEEPYFKQLSNGTSLKSVSGDEFHNRLLSYFGRVIYDYADKYMLQATVRRDGSSRFGSEYRFGIFPSVAVGWKINNEEFMKDFTAISQLKLRASYGELGNQEIGDYQYEAYINPYVHTVFGNTLAIGATQIVFATPDIRWETKKSTNIGLDLGLFNQRITLTAEYYQNKSEDLLVRVPIPESTGVYPGDSPIVNGASIKNSGIELTAGYRETFGGLTLNVNANVSTLKNEVLSLGYGDNPIYSGTSRTAVGTEVGELYGYIVEGIFQTPAEISALNAKSPIGRYQESSTAPGDYKFKDLNGRDASGKLTGSPDGKIDDDDRTYLGSAIPKVYFGMNVGLGYKNFDFSTSLNGVSGNKIFNAIQQGIEGGAGWDNYAKTLLNRWTPTNTNTDMHRVVIGDPNKNGRVSDRSFEPGSYLKLASVELGYTFPKEVLSRVKIANLRLYVSGQNVLTFTKYTGFDPDFKNDGMFNRSVDNGGGAVRYFTADNAGSLPNPRTWLIGVQVGF